MGHRGTETEFELATIDRLEAIDYQYVHGEELDRPREEVVLRDRLTAALRRFHPDLSAGIIDEAARRFANPDGVDTIRRNLAFNSDLTRGVHFAVEREDGSVEHRHIYPIDWEHPEANEFLVVNQFPVRGVNDRRPDIIIFVNGLPLVLFELKNPYLEQPTVTDALNQIEHYQNLIPRIFDFNAITVVSDGITTLHGMWTSTPEWYAPWKSIDGETVEANTTGSMKTLIEGLFRKDRLLEYIRHFIVFETVGGKITKKGAKYHQFFAVRIAVRKSIEAMTGNEQRIGVIWHTTGSGKSLSMLFLVGILRRRSEMQNPTFVIEVDRTDLDNQLHDQFIAGKSLVGDVRQADSVDDLRKLLRTEGGEVVFTTVEKFQLKRDENGQPLEIAHPVLSSRTNIVVIADEAHRSQYGFLKGYARYLAEALPNAKRIGFTGTPISFAGADTEEIFGDVIHTYDIKQSQEDHATVPIHYEPRQIRLRLTKKDLDAALDEAAEGLPQNELERKKGRWAALARAAGAKERLDDLASDLLAHFESRTKTLMGKAMLVCMTRENCVRLYDKLVARPNCPEVKIVMTANLSEDPPEWSAGGHVTTKGEREAIKKRMIDPADPLKIVIVCDMWLTGTDIPCLHTLYIDKPMKGHSIIQAISRVNRVFRDKPHGLVVDYIGIADELREATGKYTRGGGRGEPAPDLTVQAVPILIDAVEVIRELLPPDIDYGGWRALSRVALEDRFALVYGHLMESDDRRNEFLGAEARVSSAFALVKHLSQCTSYAEEIIFYQRVRNQLLKTIPGKKTARDIDRAVRDLVDDSVQAEGVVDIFGAAGIERPDISILDDEFLQTFKDRPFENLRLKLLEKLLNDEIGKRERKNLAKARSFRELLEKTIRNYHNRLIDAAAVVRAMIEIRKDMDRETARAAALGLEEDELAFYDAVAANFENIYGIEFLRDLIHDTVQTLKRNLKVDWTAPHREDVKAEVRASVRRVLRNRGVRKDDLDTFVGYVMAQAEARFKDWPLAA